MKRFGFIWFFLLLLITAFSQRSLDSSELILGNIPPNEVALDVDISPYAVVLADSSGKMRLDEAQRTFSQNPELPKLSTQNISVYGPSGLEIPAWWIKCSIHSAFQVDTTLWLYLDGGIVDLYLPGADGTYTMRRTGTFIKCEDRAHSKAPNRLPVHILTVKAGQKMTFYAHIEAPVVNPASKYLYRFHNHIFSPEVFASFDRINWFVNTLILGILLAVGLYHLLIWSSRKRGEYLAFALFVLCNAAIISIFNGYWNEFLLQGNQADYLIVFTAIFWTIIYVALYSFARSYLSFDHNYPRTSLVWLVILVLRATFSLLIILPVLIYGGYSNVSFQGFGNLIPVGGLLNMMLILIAAYAGILSIRKKRSEAILFLSGIGIYILHTFLLELDFAKVINLPIWASFNIGIVITVFLFAFGIAQQLKSLEREKANAEKAKFIQEMEAKKATELNTFKSRFFTNITHDFRTPLAVILGMAEQIRQQPTTWTTKGLDMIQRNGKKLLRMVDQILNIARLDEGSLPVRYIRGDIIAFLRKMIAFHATLADEKGISLVYQPHVPFLLFQYDPEVMEHIVSNILGNAIKFTPEGGTITIRTDQNERDDFELRISDTGPGIPPEMQQVIFDRFVKQDEEGHGIGLAIVRELVQLVNGSVEVHSEKGKGATFSLKFPVHDFEAHVEGVEDELFGNEDDPADTGKHETIENGKQIILVVEDNIDLVTYIRTLLEGKFEVHTAKNGSEGLEKAIALIPDIILSDVMMPGMDGHELCSRVKADIRTSHIPVIMLTAKADLDSKLEGLGVGADAYLTKPFNEKELFLRIEKLIESREKLKQYYRDFHTLDKEHDRKMPASYQAENSFMRKISEIVHRHLADPDFGVPELCREIGMSRSQLYRKFSSISPYSIAEFIRKTRLNEARKLLKSTDRSVTEVSLETGFKNLATFSQNFKNEFGINPSEVIS